MGPGQVDGRPLAALSQLLRRAAAPPTISTLLALLEETEEFALFQKLVAEYLPQQREDILAAGSPSEMVAAFVTAFGRDYFPPASHLEAGYIEGLDEVVRSIPIEVMGLDYDDYHCLPDMRPGFILASLLVDFEGEMGLVGDGIRATILEAAARFVPQELLIRLPQRGYTREFLGQVLGRQVGRPAAPTSPYGGLMDHARVLCHDTGTCFLDATMEDLYSDPPDWSRETVELLREHWLRFEVVQARQLSFIEWLEEDPAGHLAEIVGLLEHGYYRRSQMMAGQLELPGLEAEPTPLVRLFAPEEDQQETVEE